MKQVYQIILLLAVSISSYAQAPVIQWQKSIGGSAGELAYAIRQTTDGGYIVAGWSNSNDGDVSGNHGYSSDCWIVKLNDTGAIQWQKSLGGSNADVAYSVQQTTDGGYIVGGYSSSNDGDVSGNHGSQDAWVVKLNDTGAIQWQKSLGGSGYDEPRSVRQTTDGGYIIAGSSSSNDDDVSGNHGENDYWIVKLNDTGAVQWQKSLGGSSDEAATDIQQTLDGGYIVAGYSSSTDGDVTGHIGGEDYWVVKLNDTGAIQWQKSLGGDSSEIAYSIRQTKDTGYIVSGGSFSVDGDVTGNHGDDDYWLVKLNDTGAIQWQKSLGGGSYDFAYSMQLTADGGYIIAGESYSNDGDVSGNHGADDYWVVKVTCGLNAGIITGLSVGFCIDSIILTDTVSGGIWTMSNGNAIVSGGVVKAVYFYEEDTAIYTVANTCGVVSTIHPLIFICEGGVKVLNNTTPITIIPNPTTGTISITGATNTSIKIYNTLGQLIKQANNTDNISIAEFPAGMYFISVFNEQGQMVKQDKIIRE